MYFPFFILHRWQKRSAIQPQTIYSEFPKYTGKAESAMKSKVYFSKVVTPEKVLELYRALGKALPGNIAIKLHSGEVGNQNFLTPEFWKPVIDAVGGTVAECNTAYEGSRNTTERHRETLKKHRWVEYFPVDLLDAQGPDLELSIPKGKVIQKNYIGKDTAKYDSMLVLSHFKGHPMGGYGGALKQLAIGCASRAGKALIHSAGKTDDRFETWKQHAGNVEFPEAMADAASSVTEHFQGRIAFINVMKNLSVDCDCDSNPAAPEMQDIGILASTDPVALEQACLDLVYAVTPTDGNNNRPLIQRIESRGGVHVVEYAERIGLGSRNYEVIQI